MKNVIQILSVCFLGYLQICAAAFSGYLTFSPTTSAYSELCPNVINYNGRQAVSLNGAQFGVRGDKCGACIRIEKSTPPNTIKNLAIVTNVLPQGFAGDLDAPIPGRQGVARVTWDFEDCGSAMSWPNPEKT